MKELNNYLQTCSDVFSDGHSPIAANFSFKDISYSKDMLLSFKEKFIQIWEEEGYPGCYDSYESLVSGFNLNFIELSFWREKLDSDLDFWILSLFENLDDNKLKIHELQDIKNRLFLLIDSFFKNQEFGVYTFGDEDQDFIKNNMDYLRNDDYIFKTSSNVYWLHLGMSD